MERLQPATGRRIVTGLLVASALLHAVQLVRMWEVDPVAAVIDGVLAVAALVAAGAVLLRAGQAVLLGAAVVGAIGVATYIVPGLAAVLGGRPPTGLSDPFKFGALLLDALVVRLAVFTMRRAENPSR